MADLAAMRTSMAAANLERDALGGDLDTTVTGLREARRARDALRDGGDANALAAADRRVAALLADRRRLVASRAELHDRIAEVIERELGDEVALEGDVPVVLLPVRVEVRSTADQGALRVRIFPDAIHAEALDDGLADTEVVAGTTYWTAVWVDGDTVTPWPELQRAVGQRRAPWVAHALRPTNLDARPAVPPEFPDVAPSQGGQSVARTLPDRFVVRIEQDGQDAVVRHTRPIPDELPVGLVDVDQLEQLAVDDQDLPPIDESLRWLVDYDEAIRVGMAITVPLAAAGQPVERVTVYGVRAALSPADSAVRLEHLLREHRFSDGAEMVAQGTPTNNTESARSDWSQRTPLAPPTLTTAASLGSATNGAVMAAALGIDAELVATLPGAADAEQARAQAFNTALWTTTWGDAIEHLTPQGIANGDQRIESATLDGIRDHWVDHVRGRGPLPALRFGRQPYGVLPVIATDATYRPLRRHPAETALVPFLRGRRFLWEDAVAAVPTVMGGPLDDVLPRILGTDAVLRGLRVRTVFSSDEVIEFALSKVLGDPAGWAVQQAVSGALAVLAGVGEDAFEHNTLTGKKTRTLALPLVDVADGAFIANLLEPVPRPASPSSVLQVLLAHADAISRHGLDRMASPEALDGTLRAALAETRTGVDRDLVATALGAVQAGAFDDGSIVDAVAHVDEVVGRFDARVLADRHPIAALAPPTVVQQIAGVEPAASLLTDDLGMRVIGELLRTARRRAAFQEALRVIASVDSAAERQLLLAETLDCCSHRLDAWLTSAASRRLADLRARTPVGCFIGAYGMIEHIALSTPEQAGSIDGREVLHDPGDGGYVHAPGLTHATTAAVLRSGRLTHRRGDPANEALDIDLSSTRTRDALSLLDGIRRGQTLGALLGYRLERRLHDESGRLGPGGQPMELDRFIYVLRTLAPLRLGKLTESEQPAQESIAANNVVDGLRLLEVADAVITAKLVSGPDDSRYIPAGTWQGPRPGEAAAVLTAVADLRRTHDAVADLLLAESVHQLVAGNPARAAATMDVLAAGEAVPPEPAVARMPRTGIALQHRLAIIVPDPLPPALDGWAVTPRATAEPRLEAWAQAVLGAAAAIELVDGDPRRLSDVGLSALDVVYDADGEDIASSTLAGRVRAALADIGGDLSALAITWELATAARGLLVAGRHLDGADLGGAVPTDDVPTPRGRQPDAGELLARAQAARDGLTGALAAPDPSALAAYGVRRPPPSGPAPTADEVALADEAILADARRRLAAADGLLARTQPPNAPGAKQVVELSVQVLAAVFGGGFVAVPALLPAPAGEVDRWADATGPGGVAARPGADIRPWLLRAGTMRPATSAFGETLLIREAHGARPALRVVQTPVSAFPTWVGLPFAAGTPPTEPISSVVAEVVGVAGADLAGSVGGLVVDEWTEVVPRRLRRGDPAAPDDAASFVDVTTTGLAVHANAPGARPAQAILLAMTPDGGDWTAERLVAVLDETFALARLRAVTLDQIPFAGRFLPALYFRDWSLQGEPTIEWAKLATVMDASNALKYLQVEQ